VANVKKILSEAKGLSRQQKKALVRALQGELRQERRAPKRQSGRTARSPSTRRAKPISYALTLAAAGTVHSDFTDLSSDKYKHVAVAVAGPAVE
jgi:hypothetical protein